MLWGAAPAANERWGPAIPKPSQDKTTRMPRHACFVKSADDVSEEPEVLALRSFVVGPWLCVALEPQTKP